MKALATGERALPPFESLPRASDSKDPTQGLIGGGPRAPMGLLTPPSGLQGCPELADLTLTDSQGAQGGGKVARSP